MKLVTVAPSNIADRTSCSTGRVVRISPGRETGLKKNRASRKAPV